MKIEGSAVRPGMVLEYEGGLWLVIKIQIMQPGNLRAFNQVKMVNVSGGNSREVRLRADERVERVQLDEKPYQFLYAEGELYTFMDNETYEQVTLAKEMIGDGAAFLSDGMEVGIQSYEGKPLTITLPETVTATVAEAEAVVKKQTASSSYKSAVLENGVRVMVPPFIEAGERIVVNTATYEYIERAKNNAA